MTPSMACSEVKVSVMGVPRSIRVLFNDSGALNAPTLVFRPTVPLAPGRHATPGTRRTGARRAAYPRPVGRSALQAGSARRRLLHVSPGREQRIYHRTHGRTPFCPVTIEMPCSVLSSHCTCLTCCVLMALSLRR